MSLLRDEQGNRSSARVLLGVTLTFTLGLIALASYARLDVPGPVWPLLTSIIIALVAWAAGPRVAQYVGPQAGAAARGVAEAVRRGLDNFRKDDERG